MAKDIPVLDSTKEFEATYRKFLHLYERLAADRVIANKQGETLGSIIEELKAESSLATEFKVEVRKGIKESVDKATKEVNNQIRSSIEELVTKEVSEKVKEFNKTINDATKLLTEYAVEKSMRKYWMYLIVLFSGMICYFAGYTYMRVNNCNPDAHFSDEQLATYRNGVTCGYFWDKLSKKTQDRLLSIKEGKLPAEEKSYEWLKEKNPKLNERALRKKFEELYGT